VQLALCYEEKPDLYKAQQLLEAAIRQQPDLREAHRVLARVYYRQGKKQQGDTETTIISSLDAE
jgi:Tfp pilus assembly protein PilF